MAGSAQTFNCPNCGAGVEVRAVGRSLSVVCPSCKVVIDPNDPNYKILSRATASAAFSPVIPLGTRGTFSGTKYEVVGFMVREDESGEYRWSEYLLYNPQQGFNWLVSSDDKWMFTKTLKSPLRPDKDGEIRYMNRTFKAKNKDKPRVLYVIGEFYWQVAVNDQTESLDFESSPYMLTVEKGDGEEIWTLSQEESITEMKQSFAPAQINWPEKEHLITKGGESNDHVEYILITIVTLAILFLFGVAGPPTSGSNAFTGILAVAFGAYVAFQSLNPHNSSGGDSDDSSSGGVDLSDILDFFD